VLVLYVAAHAMLRQWSTTPSWAYLTGTTNAAGKGLIGHHLAQQLSIWCVAVLHNWHLHHM
jgi:hypothetical protein